MRPSAVATRFDGAAGGVVGGESRPNTAKPPSVPTNTWPSAIMRRDELHAGAELVAGDVLIAVVQLGKCASAL